MTPYGKASEEFRAAAERYARASILRDFDNETPERQEKILSIMREPEIEKACIQQVHHDFERSNTLFIACRKAILPADDLALAFRRAGQAQQTPRFYRENAYAVAPAREALVRHMRLSAQAVECLTDALDHIGLSRAALAGNPVPDSFHQITAACHEHMQDFLLVKRHADGIHGLMLNLEEGVRPHLHPATLTAWSKKAPGLA